jgi:hypothetical protein
MQNENDLNPADHEFASALQRLSPMPAKIDPIAAAFAAGQCSARRQIRIWQGATLAAIGLCIATFLMPANRITPPVHSTAIIVSRPEISSEPLSDQSVARLQAAVLAHGLDGLPPLDRPPVKLVKLSDFF